MTVRRLVAEARAIWWYAAAVHSGRVAVEDRTAMCSTVEQCALCQHDRDQLAAMLAEPLDGGT